MSGQGRRQHPHTKATAPHRTSAADAARIRRRIADRAGWFISGWLSATLGMVLDRTL